MTNKERDEKEIEYQTTEITQTRWLLAAMEEAVLFIPLSLCESLCLDWAFAIHMPSRVNKTSRLKMPKRFSLSHALSPPQPKINVDAHLR